jgi:hypothetical protein
MTNNLEDIVEAVLDIVIEIYGGDTDLDYFELELRRRLMRDFSNTSHEVRPPFGTKDFLLG